MIVISGASNNHYFTFINFINSFIDNKVKAQLILYNLDIDEDKWINLKNKYKKYNFIYKIFDYSLYPDWYNINIDRGQYAWKPAIIYEVFKMYQNDIIIWMDAGNLIFDNLEPLNKFLEDNGVHSGNVSADIQKWTHPNTIKILKCKNIKKKNKNGACIGFNAKIDWAKNFIEEFYKYSKMKECIAPEGSSRKNHRQDQSVFSILFYQYQEKYKFNNYNKKKRNIFLGYTIHNDIGGSINPR